MKKNFVIVIILLLASIWFWFKPIMKRIPLSPPSVSIMYNQNKIETARGEYTWCDRPDGGSTYLADTPINLAKNLKTASVKKGEQIKFTYNTLLKQPSETNVYLVISNKDKASNIQLEEQVINKNSFNVPKEKGEYTFLIFASWDEGHSVSYVFKVNVI